MRCGAGSPRTLGSLAWPPTGLKRNGPSDTRGVARVTTSRAASHDARGRADPRQSRAASRMTDSTCPAGWWLWMPRRKRTRSLTIDVPGPHHGRQARAHGGAAEQLHQRHRAVAAPGAAQGHGEVRLALALVEGEKEAQEVLDLGEERPALLEGHHELLHGCVAPIQALEAVHEVRVGQEAHV